MKSMARGSTRRKEFICLAVFLTGYNLFVLRFSILWKKVGTTIHLQSLCSFIPKLNITILTQFEDNAGTSDNCLNVPEEKKEERVVDFVDIAFDELNAKHYKIEEDPKVFKSKITGRGPLIEGWRETDSPMMCSYKLVQVSFEVWGLQTKVEDFVQRCIRDVLLLGHRQAFTWIDEWHGMSIDDVREYERNKQKEANQKVLLDKESMLDPATLD